MKTLSIALALSAMILGGACADNETKTSANAPANASEPAEQTAAAPDETLTPEQLGELGAQIEKNPQEAKQLISEKGLNEQEFEQAMRKLSEDPDASKRYAEAYQKARG